MNAKAYLNTKALVLKNEIKERKIENEGSFKINKSPKRNSSQDSLHREPLLYQNDQAKLKLGFIDALIPDKIN